MQSTEYPGRAEPEAAGKPGPPGRLATAGTDHEASHTDGNRTEDADGATRGEGSGATDEDQIREPTRRERSTQSDNDDLSAYSADRSNVFNGGLYAGTVNIHAGADHGGGDRRAERVTPEGFTDVATVPCGDARLLHTTQFDHAAERLEADHIVILVAPRASGKKYAGRALLGAVTGRPSALGVSPTLGIQDLLTTLRADEAAAYFIDGSFLLNASQRGGDGSGRRHDLGAVARRLRESGSHLVATVHRGVSAAVGSPMCVPWDAPDPRDLFSHLARSEGIGIDGRLDGYDDLLARLTDEGAVPPAVVVQMVGLLVAGCSADDAAKQVRDLTGLAAKAEVAAFFDDDDAADRIESVTYLAAVAFLGGLDEATVEHQYDELCRGIGVGRHRPVPEGAVAPRPRPERAVRLGLPLLARPSSDGLLVPDTRVDVTSEQVREAIINELWARYGPDMWVPLMRWLATTAEEVPWATPAVGRGIRCLAKTSFAQVLRLLDDWWAASRPKRFAALDAVHTMASDEEVAPALLERCLLTFEDGPRPPAEATWTSELALGGPLGAAFPGVAVPVLWKRVIGPTPREPAGLALWNLLAGTTAEESLSAFILREVQEDIRPMTGEDRGRGLRCAVHVLGGRFGLDENRSVAPLHLMRQSESRPLVVGLLRAALLDPGSAEEARELVAALLRQCRSDGTQHEVASFLGDVATYSHPADHDRLRRTIQRLVRLTLRGQDAIEGDDALRNALINRDQIAGDGADGERTAEDATDVPADVLPDDTTDVTDKKEPEA